MAYPHLRAHFKNLFHFSEFQPMKRKKLSQTADAIRKRKAPNNFKCPVAGCDKRFRSAWNLQNHANVHTRTKPYKCDWPGCDFASAQRGNLVIHQRSHTGERPFSCDQCDFVCTTSSSLDVHMRMHTEAKPFKCTWPDCHYEARQTGHLSQHVLTHTGAKPCKCEWANCGYTCRTSGHLKIHTYTHTGERPHKCSWADCAFAGVTLTSLKHHVMRKHTGERPHKCNYPMCDFAAVVKRRLLDHQRRMHTEEGMRRQKKKETWVAEQLKAANFTVERELYVKFSCFDTEGKYARIDHVVDMGIYIGLIETDEGQHDRYFVSCELRRMMDVVAAIRCTNESRPIVWIRYNPDRFSVDGIKVKRKRGERMERLLQLLRSHVPTRPLSIFYLFYDLVNGAPAIFEDPTYDSNLKPLVETIM